MEGAGQSFAGEWWSSPEPQADNFPIFDSLLNSIPQPFSQNDITQQNASVFYEGVHHGDSREDNDIWSTFVSTHNFQRVPSMVQTAPPYRNPPTPPSEIQQLRGFLTAPQLHNMEASTSVSLYRTSHSQPSNMNFDYVMVRSPAYCIDQCSLANCRRQM